MRRRFGEFLASGPRRFGVYDPGCPEPSQRNRVIESTRLAARTGQSVALKRVLEPLGLGEYGHLRVLLCEGPSLLGWFGAMSGEPFTARQRTVLRALARPMHKRLLAERRLERGRLASSAMEALLDAVAVPAFIVDSRATIRELNTAARTLLDARGSEIRAALADALAHRPTTLPIELTRLHQRGAATYWLARVEIDPPMRASPPPCSGSRSPRARPRSCSGSSAAHRTSGSPPSWRARRATSRRTSRASSRRRMSRAGPHSSRSS